MTVRRLLIEADSRELAGWMAYFLNEREEALQREAQARADAAAGHSHK